MIFQKTTNACVGHPQSFSNIIICGESVTWCTPHTFFRLRQSGKKKKKITIHVKRPGAKKDEMKLALLKLKTLVQREQTDGEPSGGSPIPSKKDVDSDSDKES